MCALPLKIWKQVKGSIFQVIFLFQWCCRMEKGLSPWSLGQITPSLPSLMNQTQTSASAAVGMGIKIHIQWNESQWFGCNSSSVDDKCEPELAWNHTMGKIDSWLHSHSSFKKLNVLGWPFSWSFQVPLCVKIDVIWLDVFLPWFRSAISCPSDPKVSEVQRTSHLCLHVSTAFPLDEAFNSPFDMQAKWCRTEV